MPERKLMPEDELVKLFREGKTSREIQAINLERTGNQVSLTAINSQAMELRRQGQLDGYRRVGGQRSELIPWAVRDKHAQLGIAHSLRAISRRCVTPTGSRPRNRRLR